MARSSFSKLLMALALGVAFASPSIAQTENPVIYKEQAVLYFRTAAEYRALCYQAFNAAKRLIDDALRGKGVKRVKAPAVIVDIDETMLDNSPLEAENLYKGRSFDPKAFNAWVELRKAKPVPGALDFAQYAAKKGVAVIYVSNRAESTKSATIDNLKSAGFPNVSDGTVLLSPTGSGTKEPRRITVASKYRIIALVGDNLDDMSEAFEAKSSTERYAATDRLKDDFGKRFIVLPNPMYGTWENAVYEYKRLTSEEKASARKTAVTQER